MSTALLLTLIGLALADSTSFGTLGVPVVMMLASDRKQTGRLMIYLATITVFYFLVGVALMLGLSAVMENFEYVLQSRTFLWGQLVVGAGLFLLSWRFDSKKQKKQWEPKLGGPGTMMGLALTMGVVELATMVPYLAAIGLMTSAGLTPLQWGPVLAGYVLVMVVPPLALMAGRGLAGQWLEPKLAKLRDWLLRNAASMVGWTLAIVGFFVARDAAARLFGWLG
ncbi:GAP family protein [Nonomuraea typhae]|uniref:GAP family protein n=1 Tax=Nonomuraea typhae TaxID=2603600 RepID=A0ABW7ZCU8_9ACTN